jgi:hypothetical protein
VLEDVVLTKNSEMTAKPFQRHFRDLNSIYNNIFIVDLLSDTKAREIVLTKEYLKQLHSCPEEIQ